MKILVFNAGSSSQKTCLYEITQISEQPPQPLWEASVDWSHSPGIAEIKVKTANHQSLYQEISTQSRLEVISYLFQTLIQGSTQVITHLAEIDAVGHRVVHGGQKYRQSVTIDADVKNAIANLANLAPAHNPANLEGITAIEEYLANIPQVAVFDTAFHSNIPDAAAIYPIPYSWVEKGIRKYGFHGISHQYCTRRAAKILNCDIDSLRIVSCHLGNGASLAAIHNGHSIDTTMGFTPLDGLMMGSRCGSVDPGILIHMLRQEQISVDQLDRILNKESGLIGISGVSSDMRSAIASANQGNARAQLAIDVYIHRLRSQIAAMIASLGGIDVLLFTAGVGENSPLIRQATCEGLTYLGIKLDQEKNQSYPVDADIATIDSSVRILVIHTQEDWEIACQTWQILNS
ncbi:acetate/propionate family kinase [Calothrix sp. NIES-3974]|uniref:acetate/propionate family kinase n=1 Tax=Calothrix sp. NIES-3974 TaxID=2005462 RepID=UPI000B5DE20A|nr:acetate kinase [Calothrix sp. NIES-3974]BAZ04583.1 acetate kinase [Calothrix sp. NIES-3974]